MRCAIAGLQRLSRLSQVLLCGFLLSSTAAAVTPPSIAISFNDASIPLGGATTLNFSVTNPAANVVALTGVAFTDTLPSGVTVPNASAGICGGTVTLTAPSTITLSGATIAVNSSCNFGVTVTGSVVGVYTNTTGNVTSTNGGTGNTASASLTVAGAPTLTTSFTVSPIALNGTSALNFAITNPATNLDTLTGVGFSDTLPAGLTVPNASATVCGGTVTLTNPTGISLTGASIAPGTQCFFAVTVTGVALGSFNNITTVTSTNGGNSNTSTANVVVVSAPTIAKAFGAASIPLGSTTTLQFSIGNSNASTTLTGLAFVDSLPAGLVVANTPGLTNNCGGTATATAGSGTISLSGGSLAGASSCNISVNVTGTSPGIKNNSVQVSFTGGGANTGNASITVIGPPVLTKSFTPSSIPVGTTTSLSFTVTNPAASAAALTGVGFTDTLPTGLTVPNGSASVCNGGTATLSGGNTISLSGGSIPPNSQCSFNVTVTGTAVGAYTNTTGAVTSTNGGTGNTASAGLLVNGPPTFGTSFSVSPIALNSTSALNFTITNPATNPDTLTGVGFTDTLPVGLTVPNASATVCGGTVTLTSPTGISMSGASIAPGTQCFFAVTVTGAALGSYTNTTGNVTSTNGGTGNSSSANLAVISAPAIAKAFGAASIPLNGSTTLVFSIQNPNVSTALTGLAFVDSLPAGLVVANTPGLSNTCGGNATATAGSGTIGLSLGALAANSSCTIQVNITGTSPGIKNNSVQVSFTGGGANTGNASITVIGPPVLTKSFTPPSIPLGGTTTLSFTVTNPAASAAALTGVGFTDTLPAGLTIPNGSAAACNGGTLTQSGSNTISLSGGSIPPNSQCSFTVTVTGAAAGAYTNTTGAATSTNGGTGNTASAGLNVDGPPTITTSFNPNVIALNATTALQFIITNPAINPDSLTGVGFSDTLPVGLTVPNASATLCGGGTVTLTSPTSITLVGASIAPGQTCNFSVTVTGTALGSFTNTTSNVTSSNGGTGNNSSANVVVVSAPTIAKAFGAATIPLNGTTTLQFSITNPNPNATPTLTGLAFVDSLPAGLVVANTPGVINNCGGTVTATAASGTISLAGGTLAAASTCTISVNVTGTSAGVKNNSVQVSFTGGGANTGNASITVVSPPVITKVFGAVSIPLNGTTSLQFQVQNNNAGTTLTGIGFTDTLPAGLVIATPNGLAGSCGGGTITATAGSGAGSLTGATLAASSSCTFSVNVKGVAAGQFTNTTGTITSTEGGTGGTASTSIKVEAPPSITKSFSPTVIAQGASTALTFTITSPAANADPLVGVAFTDVLPAGLTVPNASATVCGGTVTLTSPTTIALAGATVGTGGCIFAVTVTGATSGQYTNTTGAVSSTNGGTGNTASANLTVTIPTTSTVVPSPASPTYGQPVTFTATVTSGSGTPTGSATFTDTTTSATLATNVPLNGSGVAAFTTSTLAAGSHTIQVSYTPTGIFAASTGTVSVTITKAATTTTLVSKSGQLVATVAAVTPATGVPTGTVQFLNGTTVLGTVTLVAGVATIPAPPGTFTAVYSGDANFTGSTSNAVTLNTPSNASLTLSSGLNPSSLGQAVTFTAQINTSGGAPGAPSPTGTVQFFDGTKLLGTGTVSGGQATFTTSALGGGNHTIIAQYSGDSAWPAASATFGQTVNAVVTMSLAAAPTTPVFGQTMTLTASVTAATVPTGFSQPTGQVTFSIPGSTPVAPATVLGTGTLASGVATLTVNNLPVGTVSITATYGGDGTWDPRSTTITLTVAPAQSMTTVSLTLVSGQPVLTAAVVPAASGAGTPTGSVQFIDISTHTTVGSATLTGGKALITVTANTWAQILARPIAAVYAGDSNFTGSTSPSLPAVTNVAANLSSAFAADAIAALFGVTGLNGDTPATLPLTTSLAGVTVTITDSAGTARQALLYGVFASAGQVNFVIPSGTAAGLAVLTLTLPGGGTTTTVINIAGSAAGVFTANQNGQGPYAGQVVYVHGDGSQTITSSVVLNPGSSTYAPSPINLTTPGDGVYLVLYGTGILHAASVTATVNGVSVPVTYSGAQGSYPGLDQINLGPLPASLAGAGTVNLVLTVDGQAANTVTLAIQ
ncbi:MAG TPA: Ig-like domain repeat protein [Bryobacteraceae bacterium]|nr:Ig-like domain repeat protein [Bryobacteraceae bacterium]